jgi:Cu(I)/Ag(I) efflux system membrane fusion protein
MKKQILVVSLGLTLIVTGVKAQNDHTGHRDHAKKENVTKQASNPVFEKQLAKVYDASMELKDAFVSSDASKVKSMATKVKNALGQTDMKLLKGQAHTDWMTYLKSLNTHLDKIQASTSIADQRSHFALYNEALYKSIKAFGVGEKQVYYQHCPMALNNEGANWLSDTKEIRNPYFGAKMLKCGSTKEVIN